MNTIKYYLWKLGLAKHPSTNLTRLKELQGDYTAAINLAAELTIRVHKLESPKEEGKKPRRHRPTKK